MNAESALLGTSGDTLCKTENIIIVALVLFGLANIHLFKFFKTWAKTETIQFTAFTLFCMKWTLIEKVHEKIVGIWL